MKARYFNKIEEKNGYFYKSSQEQKKLRNEYDWMTKVRKNFPSLEEFIPEDLSILEGNGTTKLAMKYYPMGDLGQEYLKETNTESVQKRIKDCIEILKKIFECEKRCPTSEDMVSLMKIYINKTLERLIGNPFKNFDLKINGEVYKKIFSKERLKAILDKCIDLTFNCPYVSLIHGDFFFSNILISQDSYKIIDPRGDFGGMSLYGDPRYDLAKLRHSINGGYDYIINEMYSLEILDDSHSIDYEILFRSDVEKNTEYFDNLVKEEFGFNIEEIKLIEALLFLTMIPLHSEDERRQLMFMGIALTKLKECGL